jgi:DNA polymerase III alpha subunit
MGINQVEKEKTKNKVMKYKPKSIENLCAFIAAIRPSFQSVYKIFENRQHYSYNIPSFDNIIINTGLDESFILLIIIY